MRSRDDDARGNILLDGKVGGVDYSVQEEALTGAKVMQAA
jgi:hypothetical protein